MSNIKTLNGYSLVDAEAREQIGQLSEEMGKKQPAGAYVKTVNGAAPDASGNVVVEVGSDVSTDATLTQEGQAADAKAVGDEIRNIKSSVGELEGIEKTVRLTITEGDIEDGAILMKSGNVVASTNYVTTKFMPLDDFEVGKPLTLRCILYGSACFAFYDFSQKLLLSVGTHNCAEYGLSEHPGLQFFTITPPEGASFVRISGNKSYIGSHVTEAKYESPSDLVIEGKKVEGIREEVQKIKEEIYVHTTDFKAVKTLVLGDSISTDYYGNYEKWATVLLKSGFFSAENLNNNSVHATGFVARLNGEENDFISRVTALEDKDTYDLVIVFGGINDYIRSVPMGETGGDILTEFKPAVDYFFDYMIKNFTQARIVVLSPLRMAGGETQAQYSDYIKQVAKSYSLPVLNLTDESGFCPSIVAFKNRWTLTEYEGGDGVTGDGLHPNAEYERRFLAPMIRAFLQSVM